jgi:pyruvate/2-oxoglutarate dehydrogenase complex dihydrolipoamide acyltransferase (E2) component
VVSPARGQLGNFIAQLNDSYAVGAVLGQIEVTQEEAARIGLDTQQKNMTKAESAAAASGGNGRAGGRGCSHRSGLPVPANAVRRGYLSPRLKARMNELGLHAADLAGIAAADRRARDHRGLLYIKQSRQTKLTPASSMRCGGADAMRRAGPPLARWVCRSTGSLLRASQSPAGQTGPALYGLRALAIALSENSAPAGRLVGNQIVHPSSIDVGFAVEADDGVLVPVIRNADKGNFLNWLPVTTTLLNWHASGSCPPMRRVGSIATITNYGTFGLSLATPIPLPEQTLVLGMGAGRKAGRWDEAKAQFVPVTEAHLTVSFDHRVLDGGAAGRLLGRVVHLMMHPEQL